MYRALAFEFPFRGRGQLCFSRGASRDQLALTGHCKDLRHQDGDAVGLASTRLGNQECSLSLVEMILPNVPMGPLAVAIIASR